MKQRKQLKEKASEHTMSNVCRCEPSLSSRHPLTLPLYVSVYSYIVTKDCLVSTLITPPPHPPHAEPPPTYVIITPSHLSEANTGLNTHTPGSKIGFLKLTQHTPPRQPPLLHDEDWCVPRLPSLSLLLKQCKNLGNLTQSEKESAGWSRRNSDSASSGLSL